jgi:hypothetical protein
MRAISILVIAGIFLGSLTLIGGESEESYDSIVIFRNDDVTTVDRDLRDLESIFEKENVPVTHSIIPSKVEDSQNYSETCGELRNLSSIAIHGYNHDGQEFKYSKWDEIEEKILRIDNFSEECLHGRPDIFVPPHNAISSSARILLNESGFEVISADRKMAWQTGSVTVRENRTEFLEERPLELGQSSMLVDHWYTEPVQFENFSNIQSDFDQSVEDNEIHVQVLHYKALMENNKSEELEGLIEYMKEEDVYFTSFGELVELFAEDSIRFDGDNWVIKK